MLKSAQVFKYINHAEDFGLNPVGASFEFSNVIQRSRSVSEKMSKGVEFLLKKNKIDVLFGNAKVKAGKKVAVEKDGEIIEYSAEHIILATGARSRELPNLPQDGKKVIGYRQALTLPKQPKSMIVVGSGAIGVEFAYFYATMGTQVTIVEFMPNIVPVEDEEVSKHLERAFKKAKVKVMTSASVESVDTSGEGVIAKVKTEKGEVELQADILLSAVGVTANIENIGLEEVENFLKDKITVIGGPSGVGKSSFINFLQSERILKTGKISERLQRGKHTTRDSNMIKMKAGGYIIDTPGFSSIEVPNIENREELISLFPEFSNIESCKFLNCSHTHEPGCNVKREVEENKISKDRYDFYKKTLEILLERWNRYD